MDKITDKMRLDWLGKGHNKDVYPSFELTKYTVRVYNPMQKDGRTWDSWDALNLRDAIDAAIRSKAPREGRNDG